MAIPEPIQLRGLKDRRQELRDLGEGAHKTLRVVFNAAADRVVQDARRRVPVRRGRAQKSVRARSTQTSAKVVGGGARVPYFPWLDFGGQTGRRGTPARPFLKRGRFIYAAFEANRSEVYDDLEAGLRQLVRDSGLEE